MDIIAAFVDIELVYVVASESIGIYTNTQNTHRKAHISDLIVPPLSLSGNLVYVIYIYIYGLKKQIYINIYYK